MGNDGPAAPRRWAHPPHARVRAGVLLLSAALLLLALAPASSSAAAPEAPTTQPATSITGETATLHGEINPHSEAATGYFFRYANNGSCSEGTETEHQEQTLRKEQPVEETIGGLEPNREYTFCVIATHQEEGGELETTPGTPEHFTTAKIPPHIYFVEPFELTPFVAHISTAINANNQTTTCKVLYGETTAFGNETPCEPETIEGFGAQFLTAKLEGLNSATTYHYAVLAENAEGEKSEEPGEFTTGTAEAPAIDSEAFSHLNGTNVTLEGQVNPNYQATTYSFEYATNEELTGATVVPGSEGIPAGIGDQTAAVNLTGLTLRTKYYYRLVATNNTGTSDGPIQSFVTKAVPVVTTAAAEAVGRTTAQVSGTVDPSGARTTYHFAFVEAASYQPTATNPYAAGRTSENNPAEKPVPEEEGEPSRLQTQPAAAVLTELKPGTTYHYALVATNDLGTTIGPDMTLTTLPATPPVASTDPATAITASTATITGTVNTEELPTSIRFELGTTPEAGLTIPATITNTSGPNQIVNATLSALQPATTYYYRLLATNADGTSTGTLETFTTPAVAGPTAPPATQLVAWPPFVGAGLAALEHPTSTTTTTTSQTTTRLTKKQKLAKALKACNKKKNKHKRNTCRAAAKHKYR